MMKSDEDGDDCEEEHHTAKVSNEDTIERVDVYILNSLVSHGSPRSLQLWWDVGDKLVHILIDSDNTHNFV